ncbi:hypothetical protein G7Z17_g8515 [Cylindrodendrum hubeiense]|uniref:Uncharacterized protein n=1 Tax=Cylindrodendrum hubeiense TaxID=595255 RepID=A0A9P5L8Y3_9HYPO|nr:hypothetical protein G7Z17_g8515 [Cylindrodendrum hubeiense]
MTGLGFRVRRARSRPDTIVLAGGYSGPWRPLMSMTAPVVSALILTSCPADNLPSPANMEFLRWPQPLTRETANPNAATAAASAFMRREPSTSLSSAAAAAALRARPTTPTNVAQVQSKRAMRRSASVSSTGSRDKGGRDLHRTPSTSSMTDRTFRSPSPARSAAPDSHNVPPVPSIPNDGQFRSEKTNPHHKRATSLQTQPFRTASQKMNDGQGSSWFGAATAGDLSNMRHSDAAIEPRHSSDLRPSSASSSINFSYPRANHDSVSDNAMVYDANSRRMVPRAELLIREQSIRDASEKPMKKKKPAASRSGSHLKKGTVDRMKGTAVDALVPPSTVSRTSQVPTNTASTVQQKQIEEPKQIPKPRPVIKDRPVVEQPPPVQDTESESEPESESDIEEPANYQLETTREVAVLPPDNLSRSSPVKKRPSIVHELPELEDQYDQEHRATSHGQEILATEDVRRKPSPPIQMEPETTTVEAETQETETRDIEPQETQPQPPRAQAIIAIPNETISRNRVHSESPARTPHFAPTTDQLIVRHEPPPRSLSPRKSAMKHRSPTREMSPSEDGSEASSALMSAGTQEDTGLSRKKSARVSFDDQNTMVVGESAEPPEPDLTQLPSPQGLGKKPWHNIISRQKRDSVSLDDDEKMTPRPALPSFGSIREKKTRDFEERPLVRPTERPWSPQTTAVPSSQLGSNQAPVVDPGQSSDLAIGSLLAQEQSSRNAANISKYREPLPPVVTSIDSPGYISNSSDDEVDVEIPEEKEPTQPANRFSSEDQTTTNAATGSDESIPMISISHPSPHVQDEDQPDSPQDFFDLPGGFPDDNSTPKSDESNTPPLETIDKLLSGVESNVSVQTPVSTKPPPLTPQRSMESTVVSPPSPQIHDIQEENEDTDGSSIYSDAYEDLSDIDGDGFMSLDAIVDSPVNKVSQKLFEKTVAKSKEHDAAKNITLTDAVKQEPLQTQDDWEHAKAYWKSLSTDKRRQLEREAMKEAGEEADLDEAAPQPKKTKKRMSIDKSTERVVSTEPPNPDRVYQIQPGTAWQAEAPESPARTGKAKGSGGSKLKKSMRGEEPKAQEQTRPIQSGSMRRSMRSGDPPAASSHEGHMRKSLRAEPEAATLTGNRIQKSMRTNGHVDVGVKPRPSVTNQDRPVSYQPRATEQVQIPRRNQSADRAPSSATMTASTSIRPNPRRGSDSSESSFRRARPGGGEGFGFRRTMRREPAGPASDGGRGSSRFSLRSLSPTGSAFRRNSGTISPPATMGGRMRHSLRGDSSDRSTSSLRMSGFGRSPKKTKKAKKSRGNSRFADSSDEEDARPAFRSRFADSSDEDDAPRPNSSRGPRTMRNKASSSAAAAAMGVPQPQREDGDSPDLPDSDDDVEQPPTVAPGSGMMSKPAAMLNRSGSGRNSLRSPTLAQPANTQEPGTPRPGHTRRGSLMSILRRKKDGGGKISRPVSESAARRDTRLERSTEELAVIRNATSPHNSRLQKRGPNWPLPETGDTHPQDDGYGEDESHDTYVNEEKRPSTASGTSAVKQGFLTRRSTSQGAIGLGHHDHDHDLEIRNALPEDHEVSHDPPEQKKKKFGSLRKMFGLHD